MVKKTTGWFSENKLSVFIAAVMFLSALTGFIDNTLRLKERTFGDKAPYDLMGWDGQDEAKLAWDKVKGQFPKFAISGNKKSSEGKVVKLWDAAKVVTGSHLPTIRQLIGDCVGQGAKNGLDYATCAAIASGEPLEFKASYAPYHYAYGRMVSGGGRIRGPDGSTGAMQFAGLRDGGFIAEDTPGLEPYSESVIRYWAVRKPDQKWIDIGQQHLLGSAAKVTTYAEARDALANGYPVVVCSNRGFEMRPRIEGGKHWGIPSGTWNHCMCFIGVDDTVTAPSWSGGGKGACYCMNTWGPNAHGVPAGDEPPGGFWVSRKTVEYMLGQDDSFAVSNLNGFPAHDADWSFAAAERRRAIEKCLRESCFALAF